MLAAGNYGITAGGADTGNVPGLPTFNLNGAAGARIGITGPASGPMPVLMGRSTLDTVRFSNTSHIVVRRLEVDGRDLGGAGVAVQVPCNNITIEDRYFHGFGDDQQTVAISTTGEPTWGWVVRRNLIVGAGTGMYFGNSTGDSPFVAGLVEYNVVRDTIGYGMQVKRRPPGAPCHQACPPARPSSATTCSPSPATVHTGDLAQPNLLVGDSPPSGPSSSNGFAIYRNLLYENSSEGLFKCEGNVGVLRQRARHERHGPARADARRRGPQHPHIPHNTVVTGGTGIAASGGAAGTTRRVFGNAVFAGGTAVSVTSTGGNASDNVSDTRAIAAGYLVSPLAAMPSLDLFPMAAMLKKTAIDMSSVSTFPDWNRDFNCATYDATSRGACSGEGTNPGLAVGICT